jgi:lectin, mannose-binding 2
MAMWLTKQRAQGGTVFGSVDNFEGLAIFIDTYKNDRPGIVFPYIMAMVGDGHTSYDKEHDGQKNELAGCSVRSIHTSRRKPLTSHHQARNIRNQDHPTKLKLTYFHDKSLTLSLQQTANTEHWEPCFTLPGVKIPSVAYLGFSAETGELSDSHDIISVETKNLYIPETARTQPGAPGNTRAKKQKGGGRKESGGGWGWFFFKFLLFGFIVAGGYAGFTAYRSQQSRSRF